MRLINGREYPDDLHGADLSKANLHGADLSRANLHGADLSRANLCVADLHGADLREANLRVANLYGAILYGADLREANLRETNLRLANLYGADLRGADLSGANLCVADLRGANLCGAHNIPQIVYDTTLITPEGDIIGYKKLDNSVICKLLIPAAAKRHNATGRKCRAEYAVVLEGEGYSWHYSTFKYTVGATVRPTDPFDEDRWNECASGIHFFLTQGEAEAY